MMLNAKIAEKLEELAAEMGVGQDGYNELFKAVEKLNGKGYLVELIPSGKRCSLGSNSSEGYYAGSVRLDGVVVSDCSDSVEIRLGEHKIKLDYTQAGVQVWIQRRDHTGNEELSVLHAGLGVELEASDTLTRW